LSESRFHPSARSFNSTAPPIVNIGFAHKRKHGQLFPPPSPLPPSYPIPSPVLSRGGPPPPCCTRRRRRSSTPWSCSSACAASGSGGAGRGAPRARSTLPRPPSPSSNPAASWGKHRESPKGCYLFQKRCCTKGGGGEGRSKLAFLGRGGGFDPAGPFLFKIAVRLPPVFMFPWEKYSRGRSHKMLFIGENECREQKNSGLHCLW